MSLTEEQVIKVAKLARIKLKPEEVTKLTPELSKIIDWVEMLQEVETDEDGMVSVSDFPLPWREDTINDGNVQEEVLHNTKSQYGCFVVPKVIE